MTIRISLVDHGRTFATRGRATELREEIARNLPSAEDDVVIDFTGVTNITYSFADELVGKLIADGSVRVAPVNMEPTVAATVQRAVERRTHVAGSC